MEPLKRIAAIHDLSGLGKCSLTVALPVISATGVECACIPTALLSTHTGEFEGYTFKDLSDEILPIASHWLKEGAVFDGIYSGYLASPAQGKLLEEVIDKLAGENTLIVIDPVMADNGEYYSNLGPEMCHEFSRLCRRAHVITPNITEAALLARVEYKSAHDKAYVDEILSNLSKLGPEIIVLTGVRSEDGRIGNLAHDCKTGETFTAMRGAKEGIFYGTGDLFTSALTALLVRGAKIKDALEISTALVEDSIVRTAQRGTKRRFGVDFEGALPAYMRRVEDIF